MYPSAPRKAKKPRTYYDVRSATIAEDFVTENIVAVRRNLMTSYDYRKNDHINWTPKIIKNGPQKPTPKGFGSNNTHYVVPRIDAVFGGRTEWPSNPTWEDVEAAARKEFNLSNKDKTPTRNIDYWRTFKEKGKTCIQACEIKKTTGCFERPPVFLRSSQQQLEALSNPKGEKRNQIGPSLYIAGSCDYDKKWIITWWFIPVKSIDDFILFNTSNYHWEPEQIVQNDGWFKS